MGFMESYKHLDNLCKDMNGIGVTGYIKDMEQEKTEIFMLRYGKKIIGSLSIIGIYETRLLMKMM